MKGEKNGFRAEQPEQKEFSAKEKSYKLEQLFKYSGYLNYDISDRTPEDRANIENMLNDIFGEKGIEKMEVAKINEGARERIMSFIKERATSVVFNEKGDRFVRREDPANRICSHFKVPVDIKLLDYSKENENDPELVPVEFGEQIKYARKNEVVMLPPAGTDEIEGNDLIKQKIEAKYGYGITYSGRRIELDKNGKFIFTDRPDHGSMEFVTGVISLLVPVTDEHEYDMNPEVSAVKVKVFQAK